MSSHPIHVSVIPQFLPEHSQPENDQYSFAYHITITNNGDQTVTLLSRHWIIIDGNNNQQEVQGLGVIGQQPAIAPGESYSYTSGVPLETPIGTMEGSYHMINEDGEAMEIPIPQFVLAAPGMLH